MSADNMSPLFVSLVCVILEDVYDSVYCLQYCIYLSLSILSINRRYINSLFPKKNRFKRVLNSKRSSDYS